MDSPLDRAMELPGAHQYSGYVAIICPFHADTKPSCLVYSWGFVCTACGKRGSLEYLFSKADSEPWATITPEPEYFPRIPKDWSNERIARSAHKMLTDTPGLQEYLIGRGLGRAIHTHMLGHWEGWYCIPIKSEDGIIKELVFRAGQFVQHETGARFYQRSGQKAHIYVPDWKMLSNGPLFVPFGLFDAITFNLLGHAAATSTIGKGSFNPDWVGWWDNFIVIVPDLQEEKEANLLARQLGWRARVLMLPYREGMKDPNDMYRLDKELLTRTVDEFIRGIPDYSWLMSKEK